MTMARSCRHRGGFQLPFVQRITCAASASVNGPMASCTKCSRSFETRIVEGLHETPTEIQQNFHAFCVAVLVTSLKDTAMNCIVIAGGRALHRRAGE
jgi:hypothetical protein